MVLRVPRALLGVLLVLTAFPAAAQANAGWTVQCTGATNSSLQAISCPSSSTCFSAQYGGGIVRESVSGTWSATTTIAGSPNLYAISCWTTSACLVVGSAGTIDYTANAGSTWTSEPGPSGSPTLRGVSCVGGSPVSCLAVGTGGTIWSSTTVASGASATWTAQTVGTSNDLDAVSCPTAGTCFAAGVDGIWSSASGSWVQEDDPGDTFLGISCASTNACVAVASSGSLAQTADGGNTWTAPASGTTASLNAISCGDANDCVAVGANGTVIGTAGAGWVREQAGVSATLTGVSCAGAGTCTLVSVWTSGLNSAGEARATTDGGTFGWVQISSGTSANLRAVACPTSQDCFAVGDSGTLVTSTDGGATWQTSTLGSGSVALDAIACPSATQCVAAGADGSTFTYNGSTWSPHSTPNTATTVTGLTCPSQSVCFASDAAGEIAKSTDGGVTWTTQLTGAGPLQAISCSDPNDCKAVGTGSTYFWYTTNGSSWSAVPSSVTSSIPAGSKFYGISCAVSGSNPFCAAAGSAAVIFYGTQTATRPSFISASTANLTAVGCRSTSVCTAVGSGGTLMTTEDGGATWMSLSPFGSGTLEGVTMASTTVGIAVGDGGVIERMVNLTAPTCSSGSLSLTTSPSAIAFGAATLTGKGQSSSPSSTPSFIVDDETSTHPGWSLTATSTLFSNGAQTLPSAATTVTGATLTAGAGSCAAPQNSLVYPITLPAGAGPPAAVKIVSVASGTGEGPITIQPALSLKIPGNAYVGNYSSTWTISAVSGP